MLTRKVEINGRSYVLGEATAGVAEEAQEGASAPGVTVKEALAISRRLIAHCLNRGGYSISADELRDQFSITEIYFLLRHAKEISGLRDVPEGEVLGP
jgi:hypothetical protein